MGSGIFLLPARTGPLGGISLVGWALAAAGALLIALVVAGLSRLAPLAGGPCSHAQVALGRFIGFQSAFLYVVARLIANSALAIAAVGFLNHEQAWLAKPAIGAIAAAALIWLTALANVPGPRFWCRLELIALVGGLLPMLCVAGIAAVHFDPALFLSSWNVSGEPAFKAVPASLSLEYCAFAGLESAAVATAVVANPARNVPIATVCGVLIGACLYIGSSAALFGRIPAATLASSQAPWVTAANELLGPAAGSLVAWGALIKAAGALGGWMLVTGQTIHCGADRRWLARIRGRPSGVPIPALLAVAGLMMVVVFAVPAAGEQINRLVQMSVLITMLVYAYACASVWHFTGAGRAAGGLRSVPALRVLAMLAMTYCIGVSAMSDSKVLLLTAATALLTYPLYALIATPRTGPPLLE